MLLILQSIIIAIVEGLTEFVPVSSTGHMILVGNLIGFTGEFANLFEVVIQLGAILAVVVLYWDKLVKSVKDIFVPDRIGLKFWINIAVAAFIQNFRPIENKYRRGNKTKSVDNIKLRQSLIVGVFQCLSLWPGMSRSASTIMGGWIAGLSTVAAAEFSFFLAIPMMVGASGFKLIKSQLIMSNIQIISLIIGFVVAFIVSLVVIEGFIKFLQKKPMRIFAIYRIIIGTILLIMAFSNVIKL